MPSRGTGEEAPGVGNEPNILYHVKQSLPADGTWKGALPSCDDKEADNIAVKGRRVT